MHPYDLQILKLIEILKDLGEIKFDTDFCTMIGISKQRLRNIKAQKDNPDLKHNYHFTAAQIETICKVFRADPSFIFGYSTKPFRLKQTKSKQNELKN